MPPRHDVSARARAATIGGIEVSAMLARLASFGATFVHNVYQGA
jgi:hypothetical protein